MLKAGLGLAAVTFCLALIGELLALDTLYNDRDQAPAAWVFAALVVAFIAVFVGSLDAVHHQIVATGQPETRDPDGETGRQGP